MNHHTAGKWSIHGPEHRRENQLLSLEHSSWLPLVYYVNVMYGRLIVNFKTCCSKIIFVDRHYRQVDKCWNSIPNFHFLLNSIYCQHLVRKHHLKWRLSSWINNICINLRTMHYQHNLLSAPDMHYFTNCYAYTHIYIYIYIWLH